MSSSGGKLAILIFCHIFQKQHYSFSSQRYIQAQLLEGLPPPSCWSNDQPISSSEREQEEQQAAAAAAAVSRPPSQQQSSLTIQPAPPPAHQQSAQMINGRKASGEEEEIDDDEEEHLKEDQEEIDDDEDQALARRTQTSTEHGLITISQYRSGFNFSSLFNNRFKTSSNVIAFYSQPQHGNTDDVHEGAPRRPTGHFKHSGFSRSFSHHTDSSPGNLGTPVLPRASGSHNKWPSAAFTRGGERGGSNQFLLLPSKRG